MSKQQSTGYKILYYFFIGLSVILIITSFLSLVHDIPKWYLKILDFPRVLEIYIGLLLLVIFIFLNRNWKAPSYLLLAGIIGSIIIHTAVIAPYLVGSKTVKDVEEGANIDKSKTVSVLLGNVLIDNRKSAKFLEIIEKYDPDMVLAMEVDDWWTKELSGLKAKYPYTMIYPTDNAYGMNLYSKLPISNNEIKYLNLTKVPSFHADITLRSGDKFRFYGVHPVAPIPSDKYPTNIGKPTGESGEEVELLRVGKLVKKQGLPSMVAGDYNDVAWSNTARLFGVEGELNDVRVGRGLYNTFDANSYLMRWPLDHFYVSKAFKLIKLERPEAFGSDHFALYGKFLLDKSE